MSGNRDDIGVVDGRQLRFFAYQLIVTVATAGIERCLILPVSQVQTLDLLAKMGFVVATPIFAVVGPLSLGRDGLGTAIPSDLFPSSGLALLQSNKPGQWKGICCTDDPLHGAEQLVWRACSDMELWSGEAAGYATDGAVVKVDSATVRDLLGSHSTAPRWAMAYKYTGEVSVAVMRGIDLKIGRTGAITPVAKFAEPVVFGGVRVSQASLHNEDEVVRLGLYEGCRVVVKRAGDVIPQVVSVLPDDTHGCTHPVFKLPDVCPMCHSPVVQDEIGTSSQGNGSVVRRCSGMSICLSQRVALLEHFCGHDALNISGLGVNKLRDLVYMGKISHPFDIYELEDIENSLNEQEKLGKTKNKYIPFSRRNEDSREEILSAGSIVDSTSIPLQVRILKEEEYQGSLASVVGYGSKSLSKLFRAIEDSRQVSSERFLFALGLRHVGKQTSRLLMNHFGSFGNMWEDLQKAGASGPGSELYIALESRLMRIDGIGPRTVSSVLSLGSAENPTHAIAQKLLTKLHILEDYVPRSDSDVVDTNTSEEKNTLPLLGKMVVFTGGIAHNACTREANRNFVSKLGGNVANSVTAKTNILVIGDKKGKGNTRKIDAAMTHDSIEVWTAMRWVSFLLDNGLI